MTPQPVPRLVTTTGQCVLLKAWDEASLQLRRGDGVQVCGEVLDFFGSRLGPDLARRSRRCQADRDWNLQGLWHTVWSDCDRWAKKYVSAGGEDGCLKYEAGPRHWCRTEDGRWSDCCSGRLQRHIQLGINLSAFADSTWDCGGVQEPSIAPRSTSLILSMTGLFLYVSALLVWRKGSLNIARWDHHGC